ncbi:MAG: hypothetical protein ABJG14_21890 [Sulfitobacter sp.]|uniref:hypothetical protein n=1 Tax=Alphaproteobacteria TaxID=28211 RepID=UPI0032666719
MIYAVIYFGGIAAIAISYGVWVALDEGEAPIVFMGLAIVGVWVWPLLLPLLLLALLGARTATFIRDHQSKGGQSNA